MARWPYFSPAMVSSLFMVYEIMYYGKTSKLHLAIWGMQKPVIISNGFSTNGAIKGTLKYNSNTSSSLKSREEKLFIYFTC